MESNSPRRFLAERAWIHQRWETKVLLEVNALGQWHSITPNAQLKADDQAIRLSDPIVPGIVNAHSHAFQRAIAGLTETSSGESNNFWSWRERMYQAALRITPAQLEAIATQLYGELLQGGYTHVCEFHYLQHQPNGDPYADPLEMAHALIRAAQTTGIGLTVLPTLYMRAGFGQNTLEDNQRRFATSPKNVIQMAQAINAFDLKNINAGVAIHSLRAADIGAIKELAQHAKASAWPVHIHIAEQAQEVQDCLATHRQRPIEYLLSNVHVNAQWNLVHATHCTVQEFEDLRTTKASIVICPTTEANLGDGVFDFSTWAGKANTWTIGSDSHVCRSASEELRALEMSQRLHHKERNVAARLAQAASTAGALIQGAQSGAAGASGAPLGPIALGNRADFFTLDTQANALLGVPAEQLLDAWVFSSPSGNCKQTYVGGEALRSPSVKQSDAFVVAMRGLWKAL
jgi:formimidoylglutamate deiminase